MKHSFLLLGFGLCFCIANAQSNSLGTVSAALKQNADVIVHRENTQVEIEDVDKATIKIQKIFTVLNEDGKEALDFYQHTNRYVLLDEAEVKMFDQNGKQTGRYKKKDMFTTAVGEGLIEDGYVTFYHLTTPTYPVTVEFNYELKLKSILYIPAFHFMRSRQSVAEASYTIRYPLQINIRHKARLTSMVPQVTEDAKFRTIKWNVKDIPATEDEDETVSEMYKYPYVNIVADQFSYFGNIGDISSWKSFGSWLNQLYQGLDELSPERQQFFQQMVRNETDEKEKVKKIYHYLQSNFRYVSIQLGVGGMKPFSAAFTDQKKYGDCKSLSNYTKAALKAVGIRSHVAIINAGYNDEPVDADFPANDFNHVILCVPQAKDTIWLECTSSTTEFNQLGTFTENRNALLVTEDGGVLVSTPKSKPSANTLVTRTVVDMDTDLSGQVETDIRATGEFDEMINDVLKEKKDDQKAFMVLYMGYKQPDEFVLEPSDKEPHKEAKMKMAIRKVPEFNAGDKYFTNPKIHKVYPRKLPAADKRKLDFYFRYPFDKRDTTVLKLPSNFKPDVLPNEKVLTGKYTRYRSKCWFNEKENAIYTETMLLLEQHKIPASDYQSVKNFFDEVVKDEAQRIVIKKTGESTGQKKAF